MNITSLLPRPVDAATREPSYLLNASISGVRLEFFLACSWSWCTCGTIGSGDQERAVLLWGSSASRTSPNSVSSHLSSSRPSCEHRNWYILTSRSTHRACSLQLWADPSRRHGDARATRKCFLLQLHLRNLFAPTSSSSSCYCSSPRQQQSCCSLLYLSASMPGCFPLAVLSKRLNRPTLCLLAFQRLCSRLTTLSRRQLKRY